MNEKLQALIEKLKKTSGKIEFFEELKGYFEENYGELYFGAMEFVPFPPFYFPLSDSLNYKSIINELSNCNTTNQKEGFVVVNDYFVYPLLIDDTTPKYILVFNNQINNFFDEIKSLCSSLNDIFKIIAKNYQSGFDESTLQNANLISQMSHDINSMISLIKSNLPEIDTSISDKMKYAEKMTKDILQYVREIHILDSEVEIVELLESIVSNITIPKNIEISKNYNLKSESINLDVELIDRAINEIIQNSVFAIENGIGKIIITATIDETDNLFFKNKFLAINIEDNGSGITPDFLEFVKNPFFTTRKSAYHSGLGLSIADKIIEAHSGYLSIENNQENKTRVTIYLPIQGKENE